ncbi:MAG: hypothetical protein NC431_08910 [Firmicutes bacterium]|nr:hypothetical protein [Bacteroidales bacterium]MCM1206766.1 hypothetical protein [Bacillota bacterium]MCM1510666.1 hypothetical protein [Clostridium sp.]
MNLHQIDTIVEHLDAQEGNFNIEIELSDTLMMQAKGHLSTKGYVEDDYLNGTGAYIETDRVARVRLTPLQADKDGELQECELDTDTERAIKADFYRIHR